MEVSEVREYYSLPKSVSKERKCMCCRNPFPSQWSGDRVCTPCRKKRQRSGQADWEPAELNLKISKEEQE